MPNLSRAALYTHRSAETLDAGNVGFVALALTGPAETALTPSKHLWIIQTVCRDVWPIHGWILLAGELRWIGAAQAALVARLGTQLVDMVRV